MKKYFILLTLVFSYQSFASSEICSRVQSGVAEYLEDPMTRISFQNQGGLLGGGVCWWHSRFQRAGAFLAVFAPEKPKPTKFQAYQIVQSLRSMNKIVEIPGYENFYQFTRANHKYIQSLFENWQIQDGLYNQEWIRGLSGDWELPADKMKVRMDTLFRQFNKSIQPMWIMAQMKGVTSHSFIVLGMTKTENGYSMRLIDSKDPSRTKTYEYKVGQRFIRGNFETSSFVPYLGFQKDFLLITKAIERKCGKIFGYTDELPRGEIEIKK